MPFFFCTAAERREEHGEKGKERVKEENCWPWHSEDRGWLAPLELLLGKHTEAGLPVHQEEVPHMLHLLFWKRQHSCEAQGERRVVS